MGTAEARREFVLPAASVLTGCSQGRAPSRHQWQGKLQQLSGRQRKTRGTAPGTLRRAGKSPPVCHTDKFRRPEFLAIAGRKLRNPLRGRV